MRNIAQYQQEMQQLALRKMQDLAALDFHDYVAMVLFFEELQPATVAPAIRLDRLRIAYEFTHRGYIPDVGSAISHDVSDIEPSARFLIGKALGDLMKYGSINEMYLAAAREWLQVHTLQRS